MKDKTAVMIGGLGLAGVLFFVLAKKARAEEPPYIPGEEEEEPIIPTMPKAKYFAPRSISPNQVQQIWIQPTSAYSFQFEVHNPLTGVGIGSSGTLSPNVELSRIHFDYLKSLPTLSDVDAGQLGGMAVLFGFK